MSVGRPSEYTPEIIATAQAFIAEIIEDTEMYPSVAALAHRLRIARSTVYKW